MLCRGVVRPAPGKAGRSAVSPAATTTKSQPWKFGFQCNERYLDWDGSAQAQLVKLCCKDQLGWTLAEVEEGISELATLLPDLPDRLQRMNTDLLRELLARRQDVAAVLLALRAALPSANVSALASRYPALLTKHTAESMCERLDLLRSQLPGVANFDAMVEEEPRIIDADVEALLAEVRRLMPGKDPHEFLASNPAMVMDMASQGMRPSLEDEPGLRGLLHHSKG